MRFIFLLNDPGRHLEVRNNLSDWMLENVDILSISQLPNGLPLYHAAQMDTQEWHEFVSQLDMDENDASHAIIMFYATAMREAGTYAEGEFDYYCLIRMIKDVYNKNVRLNFLLTWVHLTGKKKL